MTRKLIKDSQEPLTVLELRDFLNRLVMGGCSNFKIVNPARNSLTAHFDVTRYILNGHDNTVTLLD